MTSLGYVPQVYLVLQQCDTLTKLIKEGNIKKIMQIGFRSGHMTEMFLQCDKNIHVTIFDTNIGDGIRYFAEHYPGRFEFIPGNSMATVPVYSGNQFDLIFLDGSNDYNVALQDLHNCRRLAHVDTLVVQNNTVTKAESFCQWNDGPVRAWGDVKQDRLVTETFSEEYGPGQGMSVGKYAV